MKILQIHNKVPFPPKDGGSIAVYNLSLGFAEAGCRVEILSCNTKKHYVDLNSVKNKVHKNINIKTVNINTEIRILKALKNLFFSKIPYNAERFINEDFKKELKKLLINNKYDFIQIEGLYMMPYIETIKKHSKAKIVFRAHNIEHEIWEQTLKQEKSFLKKIYLQIIAKRMKKFELSFSNKYDILIPITQRDADYFNKTGNKKSTIVCPTGVNASKYKSKEKDFKEIEIFHIGSLDWTPNQEGLIWFLENVWTEISKKYKNLTFSIAGRNAPDWLEKTFKNYKNINYLGEIDNAVSFMKSHDVMIVPLLSGSGMRIKIIEGMASGNIILSTSKGAEGINGKNGTDFLIANTINEFKQTITEIYENKIDLKSISFNAQQFILNNFDNFAISKSLIEFYKKQLKN
ncbi:MAG: glycosyltransferase family 4 protein [Bacteroidales bacterium]|nr:glycosyltransferase family 4 protein [Bacteroidales bacterium]